MRRIAPLILLLLSLFFLALPAFVSLALPAWGPAGCPPVGGFVIAQPPFAMPSIAPRPVTYSWRANPRNTDQLDLYRNDQQVGAWFHSEAQFYRLAGDAWQPEASPITPPAAAAKGVETNFGIDVDRLGLTEQGVYLHAGSTRRELTREEAKDLVQNGLPDDRHKPQLTFISADKGKREAFLRTVNSTPGLSDVVARAVPPDYLGLFDSETKAPLFRIEGDTIYLQQPDGKVLARMGNAQVEDVARVAKIAESIRRPRPYDPDKDSDPRRPKNPDPKGPDAKPVEPQPMPQWALLLMGAGGAALLLSMFGRRP